MGCPITLNGIKDVCEGTLAGILHVYLIQRKSVPKSGITLDDATGIISAITPEASEKFKEYGIAKNTANFITTDTGAPGGSNSGVVQTDLPLEFKGLNAPNRLEMEQLRFAELSGIIVTANGEAVYFGYDYPAEVTLATSETGTARTDFSGFKVTLTDYSKTYPYFVDPSIIDALVG